MNTQRTVLVTGGNRGIGRGIAQTFLNAGHRVAVNSRNGEAPEGVYAVSADVTDESSIDHAFSDIETAGTHKRTLMLQAVDEGTKTPTGYSWDHCGAVG